MLHMPVLGSGLEAMTVSGDLLYCRPVALRGCEAHIDIEHGPTKMPNVVLYP
jgi:hypothetical protein